MHALAILLIAVLLLAQLADVITTRRVLPPAAGS